MPWFACRVDDCIRSGAQQFASEGAVAVAALDAVARQRVPVSRPNHQGIVMVAAEWIQLPPLRERAVSLLFVMHQRECAEGRLVAIDGLFCTGIANPTVCKWIMILKSVLAGSVEPVAIFSR